MRIIREKTAKKLFDLLVMDDMFLIFAPIDSEDLHKVILDKFDVIKKIYGIEGLTEYLQRSKVIQDNAWEVLNGYKNKSENATEKEEA